MLRKANRLSRSQINLLFRTGRRRKHPAFTLIYSHSHPPTQISVLTPASVAKQATVRNRLRRLVYSSLATDMVHLPATLKVAILLHPPVINRDPATLATELTSSLNEIA